MGLYEHLNTESTSEQQLVSIVIPCLNSEAYIVRAIESVLRQHYQYFELLLVDNGSQDKTVDILQAYVRKYPGKIHLLREKKLGAPAARNKGLANSRGAYVQFLDSDDELEPEKLLDQVELFQKEGSTLVIGNWIACRSTGKQSFRENKHQVNESDVWEGLITSALGRTSSMLFQKKALIEIGGWNESKTSSQEYELMFRLLIRGATVAISKGYHTKVYIREESIHNSSEEIRKVEIAKNYISLRMEITAYLKENGMLNQDLKRKIDNHLFSYLMRFKEKAPFQVWGTYKETGLALPGLLLIKWWTKALKSKLTTTKAYTAFF